MKLSTSELMIIEKLLKDKINEDYDPEIKELLCKVQKEIDRRNYEINMELEWFRKDAPNIKKMEDKYYDEPHGNKQCNDYIKYLGKRIRLGI